ncbi:MAG: hypothetical protein V4857_11245 [Pseudomonadota bacterium]
MRINATPFASRLTAMLVALAVFCLGWTWIADQQNRLWQRLPASAAERFVADRIAAPLPRLPGAARVAGACARPLGLGTQWRAAWLRAELAGCLADPDGLVDGAAAAAAITGYEDLIAQQLDAAGRWLAAYDAAAPGQRAALRKELAGLKSGPGNLLAAVAARLPSAPELAERTPVGRRYAPDHAADALRAQVAATRARVRALAQGTRSPGQRARDLALEATGLQLVTDYGHAPPRSHLTTARNTLADALEWQRRARGYEVRGFSLQRLQALPQALFCAGALLMLAAFASRGGTLALCAWALVSQLLALGALMLTDLALTADPALRYLAERQFLSAAVGDWSLPLTLGGGSFALWWPLALVAPALLLLRGLRDGQGRMLAPVRAWVGARGGAGGGLPQSIALLAAGAACVLLLGMPAALSELLILLGCIGVASYLARQAPHANGGAGLQPYNLAVVGVALALALGGACARGDLGHALLALALAGCFAWLFGGRWMRALALGAAAAGSAMLALCLFAGKPAGPLAALVALLPAHAQDRFDAMFAPLAAGSSDLARIGWLLDSAGAAGWGPGYVPWQGLASARASDGLPLQGASDYVLALAGALWGQAGGMLLMCAVLLVFGLGAVAGMRSALRAAMPPAIRWLAALGGFGCIVMAAKVLLSVGGVARVLPLTGLPVGLLGYGPATHLASLLYLTLALGTMHVRPIAGARGVDVLAAAAPAGAVRRRGAVLALLAVAGLGLLLGGAACQLRAGAPADIHLADARLRLAGRVAAALVPLAEAPRPGPLPCAELAHAVAAWNLRLAGLARALRLDPARLLHGAPPAHGRVCRALARSLGQMLAGDLARLVGSEGTPTGDAGADRLGVFDKPRAPGARKLDYSTANAWWGRPGCVAAAGAPVRVCADQADADQTGVDQAGAPWDQAAVPTDAWLERQLAPQLMLAVRQPASRLVVNGRSVARGPVLGLTLAPALQQLAQRSADCFTGRLHGADCDAVLPRDAAARARHFGPASLRAGAIGIVLAEVDSGRVVALAGAVSDCSLANLGRAATPDAQGRVPALRGEARCAQLPDRRSDWLAQQHPAQWMVAPGSALKPFSVLAGIDAGVVGRASDGYWRGILAESHERLPVQRTALLAGQGYLDVLAGIGFGHARRELLWGGAAVAAQTARWHSTDYAGAEALRPTRMPLAQAEQIRGEKQAGVNVDRRYGAAVMTEFLAARRLADAALGGGDIGINALGLADAWRALDLRARGRGAAPELHLLEQAGHAPGARPLDWASADAARRVMAMSTGVSARAAKGTAQGACRVVYGACPAQGLAGLSGKTGSADFLSAVDGPYVKPGARLPAKLFGAVFGAPDGKRYAVAVMALRVREGDSRTLELDASSAAEAAFTLMREMGVRADD